MEAERAAKRQAAAVAIEKVLGPNASLDPRIAAKVDAVASQIPEERVIDVRSATLNGFYEVTATLVLDDKEFRSLLSDLGIAVNTATARSHSILAVMDEFLTSPRDLNAPLEELEVIRSEVGQSFHDRSKASSRSASASASASASETHVDARASSSARGAESHDRGAELAGRGGSLAAHDRGSTSVSATEAKSLQASDRRASAQTRSASSASSSTADVASEQHDNQFYMKLVKYQPQGGSPEKTSQTYNALVGQLQDYDLRVLDNDAFRSRYFKGRPLTIQELQDGAELAKYVSFARTDGNADFFMVGTSVIVDAGTSPVTGDLSCTGILSLKTYSTADGESIASETISEASSGRTVNDCAGNLAKKLAALAGPVVGARVQEYWKRRSAYGREFVLTLTGKSLPLMVKTAFAKALKGVPGVEADTQRASSSTRLQVVLTYKGADPLDQAIAAALGENAAFAALDSRTNGNQVLLCLGPCDEVAPAEASGGSAR